MNFQQMEDYSKDPKILEKFGRNVTAEVKKIDADPVIGRDENNENYKDIIAKDQEQSNSNR